MVFAFTSLVGVRVSGSIVGFKCSSVSVPRVKSFASVSSVAVMALVSIIVFDC